MAQALKVKQHNIGGLQVRRLLPNAKKRMVGPFIFLDQMGPGGFEAGQGVNVPPHPHIGLSTLTYLFEGNILHRDSLGNRLSIQAGDVNWMTAGRGIVHSEREAFEVRANRHCLHGLQAWVALPREAAELTPSFQHLSQGALPESVNQQVMMRLIAGEAYGMSAPVKTYSPMFYVDVVAGAGSEVARPNPAHEAALFVVAGNVKLGALMLGAGDFALFDDEQQLSAASDARFILLGGEPWPEVPHIYWNFVSFSRQRIEQAKDDWQAGRFAKITGDDQEFVPLP